MASLLLVVCAFPVFKTAYMDRPSKIFVLSPHIDDAAFGLALTIAKCAGNKIDAAIADYIKKIQDKPESSKFSNLYHRLGRLG